MAGGVALNCVANGKVLKEKIFENIWVQPAAGDAGGSLGAALAYWHQELNQKRKINPNDSMKGSYLGPKFENQCRKRTYYLLMLILKNILKMINKYFSNELSKKKQ